MKKYYQKDERTCTCANKEKERQQFKIRTAGWQFVLDQLQTGSGSQGAYRE